VKIAVIGTGYVGLVAGTCLADLGNSVICVDQLESKIRQLRRGKCPIFEPGLTDLMQLNRQAKRLRFTTNIVQAIKQSEVIFIAVGTPPGKDHRADLSAVKTVAKDIGIHMTGYRVVVTKSTVPVGTNGIIADTIRKHQTKPREFDMASNPEFLREGEAVRDFVNPDRIVVGVESDRAQEIMQRIYGGYARTQKPIQFTDIRSAEMIKYASNAFLATKISFINEVSRLCEEVGADIKEVAKGMGLDERIGPRFLQAGVGYGGSCFPKDVKALMQTGKQYGTPFRILDAVELINAEQRQIFVKKIRSVLPRLKNKHIAVWGLSFKPKTDDLREAPSLTIIQKMLKAGATVAAFDPVAEDNARELLPEVTYYKDPYQAVKGADALLVITEWNEFRDVDLKQLKSLMRQPIIVDGRNVYDPAEMRAAGFNYQGIGRGGDAE
jgi:UDPglucose 6-dehydrogenase